MSRVDTAKELAARTKSSYYRHRWGDWTACALLLLNRGFTEKQVVAIMLSEHMRWASDSVSGIKGTATIADLDYYITTHTSELMGAALLQLVIDKFGEG